MSAVQDQPVGHLPLLDQRMVEAMWLEPRAHAVDLIAVTKQLHAPSWPDDAEVDAVVTDAGPLARDAHFGADERGETAVPLVLEGGLGRTGESAGEVGCFGLGEETGPREALDDGFAELGKAGEPVEWEGLQLICVQGVFDESVG